MTSSLPSQTRSVYRSILRELPRHQYHQSQHLQYQRAASASSLLSSPSPLQTRIRQYLSGPTPTPTPTSTATAGASISGDNVPNEAVLRARLEEARQFTGYARAQGLYTALLERYNPGADMDEQERVRLTARRVGMDMPAELEPEGSGNGNGNGNSDR